VLNAEDELQHEVFETVVLQQQYFDACYFEAGQQAQQGVEEKKQTQPTQPMRPLSTASRSGTKSAPKQHSSRRSPSMTPRRGSNGHAAAAETNRITPSKRRAAAADGEEGSMSPPPELAAAAVVAPASKRRRTRMTLQLTSQTHTLTRKGAINCAVAAAPAFASSAAAASTSAQEQWLEDIEDADNETKQPRSASASIGTNAVCGEQRSMPTVPAASVSSAT